jgi:hypothetical protein
LREQKFVVGQVGLVFVRGAGGFDWVGDVRAAGGSVSYLCVCVYQLRVGTHGLPAVMYSVIGRGWEIATMFCTSRLASPSSASGGGCGRSVAPSSGLTSTTEKLEKDVSCGHAVGEVGVRN